MVDRRPWWVVSLIIEGFNQIALFFLQTCCLPCFALQGNMMTCLFKERNLALRADCPGTHSAPLSYPMSLSMKGCWLLAEHWLETTLYALSGLLRKGHRVPLMCCSSRLSIIKSPSLPSMLSLMTANCSSIVSAISRTWLKRLLKHSNTPS